MNNKHLTIIITSNEPWGEVWFSKHHYANELSLLGHKVFFINAPLNWKPWHIFSFSVTTKKVNSNLIILNYKNNLPLKIFKKLFLKLNDLLNSWKIANAVKTKKVIWWQFDPFRFIDIYFFYDARRIYHIVDPFQHVWSDKKIAQQADLLVSVSNYYKPFYKEYNNTFLYIPHGICTSDLNIDENLLFDIKKNHGRGFILFIGTINIDVDLDLIKHVSKELKENLLLIIGPLFITGNDKLQFDEICTMSNVRYLNTISSNYLKYFVVLSKVGIVPYKRKRTENIHRTPLKIMNYLSQNKPVVTTINYELSELNNKCVFVTDSDKEFIAMVKALMKGEIKADLVKTKEYTEKVSYPKLIQTILEELYR